MRASLMVDPDVTESKTALRPCPICKELQVEVMHHQKFVLPEGHILPSSFDIVCCSRCGFAYADTPASQETYDRYYSQFSKYEDNLTATGGGGSESDAQRLRDTAHSIARVIGDRGARILDIGCANGGLLGELKECGFSRLLGVDPSPSCVANTRKAFGIEAKVGSIRKLPAGIGKFDLVILSHVLEHVADLQATVSELQGVLSETGWLYVEAPDASRYAEFLLAPFQDFNTEHINHFGLSSLSNLFEPHGFVLESNGQKEIESSPGCPYPAIYSFFRRTGSTNFRAPQFQVDESLRARLLEYIEASGDQLGGIEERLASVCADAAGLMVWGTGQLTMKLLAETCLGRARVTAFIDSNPINQGKTLAGVPIIAPSEVSDHRRPILVASTLHEKEIIQAIREVFRLPNQVLTLGG